ncbi:MAG: sulfite exporter TauE/SafE family protein [Gammaproteobacteria bacterium]
MPTQIDLTIFALYLLVGAVAGSIAGLMGIGGGIIIVPVLLFLFIRQGFPAEVLMHMVIATSLATIVFTSLSSVYAHHKKGAVLWSKLVLLVPGIVIGGVIGALIADQLASNVMQTGFGMFECIVALQIGTGIKPSPRRSLPANAGLLLAGSGIGGLSTILGIGGGSITVPFLLWCNVNIRNAVATSSACTLPIALTGASAMMMTGWNNQHLPEGAIGYIYWPAVIGIAITSVLFATVGARLAHSLPVELVRRIFTVVIAIAGIRMLV